MTTKRRKVLALFLALILSISALPISHVTAFAVTSGDFEYSVISEADKTCEITKYTGSDEVLNIPSQLGGYTVTSIGDYAFSYCTSLTNITIPKSITSVGEGTFYGCSSLTRVIIPGSVTSIDYATFYGCASLTDITIPEGVTSIGELAFAYCSLLTSVTIPGSVTSIGMGAYGGCPSLEKVEVDAQNPGYSSIDGVLFNKEQTELICYPAGKSDTSYTIPEKVTSIGFGGFYDCTSLTGITIPSSVTSIGDYAFSGCTSLTGITIPGNVTSIGNYAFQGCEGIKILGFDNSAAKTYAGENSIEFCLMGDIDGNGAYESNDYSMLSNMAKYQTVNTSAPREVGDINLDGAVDAFDAIQLDLYLHNVTDIHGNKIA